MSWSKLKTIIIFILIFTNLFLLFLVGGQQVASKRYETQTLHQMVDALALNGITLDKDALPRTVELPALTMANSEQTEAAAAKLLLTGDIINTNNGGLRVYSSVSGNVSFRSNGDFSASISLSAQEYASPEEHAIALLETLGIDLWILTANGNQVTTIQKVNGVPAFNLQLTLTYEAKVLTSMEGKLLLSLPIIDTEHPPSITIPTVLAAMLELVSSGAVYRSIHQMTAGYLTTSALSEPARLIPVWLVETDVANYYVDATTGTVSRVS